MKKLTLFIISIIAAIGSPFVATIVWAVDPFDEDITWKESFVDYWRTCVLNED